MAEQWVHVDNPTTNPVNVTGSITTTPSGTQNVAVTSPTPLPVIQTQSTANCYLYSMANIPGVVAANAFLSVFNPIGSGKTIVVAAAYISNTASAATIVTDPLRGYRITAASAGTLAAANTITKFKTSQPDSIAEVRHTGPTVTLGNPVFNVPPAITASGGTGGFINDVQPPAGAPSFTLAPGEGFALRTGAGDVDQVWNFTLVWLEV
jgi:hypothetical protein